MIKIDILLMLLFSIQASFAESPPLPGEDPEEGTSYLYPFFYDESDEDTRDPKSKANASKATSPTSWHGNIGRAEVIVEVENTDFESQCKAMWDDVKKKNKPEKQKKSGFKDEDEEEKENHSPRVSASIKWSSAN